LRRAARLFQDEPVTTRTGSIPPLLPEAFLEGSPHVAQVNVSLGGVPKWAIAHALADEHGLVGDRHADREHHGGPRRALCLYALELILALRDEGHGIDPGSTGENITTRGLDWSRVVPGARLRIGEVMAEITDYATPCTTIARSFAGGAFKRISQKVHPGWSRAYARVLQGGRIATGDPISVG
jgi:MOSC domain-containing protein YiiM